MKFFRLICDKLLDISDSFTSLGNVKGNSRLSFPFLATLDTVVICMIISCFTGFKVFMYFAVAIVFIASLILCLIKDEDFRCKIEEICGWTSILLYVVFIFTLVVKLG